MNRFRILAIAICALCLNIPNLWASSSSPELLEIQHQWAKANYELTDDTQEQAFVTLLDQSTRYMDSNPNDVEAIIWCGIVNSTYAGHKGGLGALKYAKEAKRLFEKAIKINPTALNGSAYTSLGTLYYKVPGFPIGFGSNKKAEINLLKALDINPNGIDSNYFYGDYLVHRKKYEQAIPVLEKALRANPRPDRPLADKGRRHEIEEDLKLALSKI